MLREKGGVRWAAPPLEIHAPGLFDTATKYDGTARFTVPAQLDAAATTALKRAAIAMFDALGCDGVARMDFFLTDEGPVLNEVNTMPGLTAASQVPRMFAAAGVDYVDRLAGYMSGGGSVYLTGEWGCCPANTSTINLINQGIDALVVSCADSAPMRPALKLAKSKGIPAVQAGCPMTDEKAWDASFPLDDAAVGHALGEYVGKQIGGAGVWRALAGSGASLGGGTVLGEVVGKVALHPVASINSASAASISSSKGGLCSGVGLGDFVTVFPFQGAVAF